MGFITHSLLDVKTVNTLYIDDNINFDINQF